MSKVKDSIRIIKQYCEKGCHVSFSGGKDSLVVLDLVYRSGVPYDIFYCNTGIDHPETIRHIKQLELLVGKIIFLQPKTRFFDDVRRWGPPSRRFRWCCDTLKKRPARRLGGLQVLGIRSEESNSRKKYELFDRYFNFLYPILNWTECDVWEYIDKHNLLYNQLYEGDGFLRVGCILCPNIRDKELNLSILAHPRIFSIYIKEITYWFEKSEKPNITKFKTVGGFLENWVGSGLIGKKMLELL